MTAEWLSLMVTGGNHRKIEGSSNDPSGRARVARARGTRLRLILTFQSNIRITYRSFELRLVTASPNLTA
jgi:hypothetical protein